MIQAQRYLTKHCRDILDECDHTLAVQTQLIYPSGTQMAVDGHPHRWEIAERLLQLVNEHLWNLPGQFPQSIEVIRNERNPTGFPAVHLLRKDVEEALLALLVKDVLKDRIPFLQPSRFGAANRNLLKNFISDISLAPEVVEKVESLFKEEIAARQCLYLIRGLLVHRILLLVLRKRHQVQYGLHLTRTPLAVPYHAKGVPSEQAEWGHPDVAILFTILSFYYEGLSTSQIQEALKNVAKTQDPLAEYHRWIQNAESLPSRLRGWNNLNVEDTGQISALWKHLRYEVPLIDYYLNHFVFPQHAKQFKTKLQASGWDIPLIKTTRAPKSTIPRSCAQSMTTGFSGTNDNKTLLPMTISQVDLPGLTHTNAEVLTYLLQPRNREYVLAADLQHRRLSEKGLLHWLRDRNIRVLIDAGAQILELDNRSLAVEWLNIDYTSSAAVYFQDNKPWVVYRGGRLQQPLFATPYAENLDGCLVYLDQAHTRGTDLKIPVNAKGALTLGPGQAKDATVQAAMRLRQLATTQSVVFFAPPEVHQSIIDLRGKGWSEMIDSHDVICWLLEQTCTSIESLHPLYFAQGIDFCERIQSERDHPDHVLNEDQRDAYLQCIQHSELQTLKRMYRPRVLKRRVVALSTEFSPDLRKFVNRLQEIRKNFQDGGHAVHSSALEEVEQEREVAYEVETIREVQKPVFYRALRFLGLHRDLEKFISEGKLILAAEGYEYSFVALQRSEVGHKRGIRVDWTRANMAGLFLSQEFSRVIALGSGQANDNYLRNVNFLILCTTSNTAIAITPEEADAVIDLIRRGKCAGSVHLLVYAPPINRKMLHFNTLKFYSLPRLPAKWQAPQWLQLQLGIFTGRLYFPFEEYEPMLDYLGVDPSNGRILELEDEAQDIDHSAAATESVGKKNLTDNPLTFLQEWISVRRKGKDFTHSPMGVICRGHPLGQDHPFFLKQSEISKDQSQLTSPIDPSGKHANGEDDEDDTASDDSLGEFSDGDPNHDGLQHDAIEELARLAINDELSGHSSEE
jgi:hypothetical protein